MIRGPAVRPGDKLHIESEVLEVRPPKSRPDQSAGDDVKSERRGGTNLRRQSACPPRAGQPTQACDSEAISLIKRRGEHQRKLRWSVPRCGGDRDEALQVEPTHKGICMFVNADEAS